MPEVVLSGCRPEPLMSYLKALGALRLVGEQKDPDARGAWRRESFHLSSYLDDEALLHFFGHEYCPTPVVGPWAGGSGFFGKDNKEALEVILASTEPRLHEYREAITAVRLLLAAEGITEKPSGALKERLLRLYRRSLSDTTLRWMDAAVVLGETGQAFPPLLGTGGNDGRLDFTLNFMQRVVELGLAGRPATQSMPWLRNCLFASPVFGLLNRAVGQFEPGRGGGPNSTQGMMGDSAVNPWDYVLMIEGSLILAGAATRRYGAQSSGRAAFPFTVGPTAAGDGAASSSEMSSARGEIWLPLWDSWASLSEVKLVFAEGRAMLGRRQVRDGADFARAAASLGVDRGLSEFVRFGFLQRSGLAYLATPRGRVRVHLDPAVELIQEVDSWLGGYRAAAKGTGAPPRFLAALGRLERAILDHSRYGGAARLADVLCALGRIERELSRTPQKAGQVGSRQLRPVALLSPSWRQAADDGSIEFRLALGLASIAGGETCPPIRANLEPIELRGRRAVWADGGRSVVSGGELARLLAAILERRLLDYGAEGLEATTSIEAAHVAAFLNAGHVHDARVLDLLWGLILVDPTQRAGLAEGTGSFAQAPPLPRSYALLKLVFLQPSYALTSASGDRVSPEAAILARLRAHDLPGACRLASRRLRAAGFVPVPAPGVSGRERLAESVGRLDPRRVEAALLFPVRNVTQLRRLVLREPSITKRPA